MRRNLEAKPDEPVAKNHAADDADEREWHPARWQSGWTFTNSDYDDIHDWAEIYLTPYGWVPVDVTYGRLDSGDPSLKWFYLGGLDSFRIAFNDDFFADLRSIQAFFRSDTATRNAVRSNGREVICYDKWSYDFAWKIMPLAGGK